LERSRVSLFVRPSSLASSWTRIFGAKVVPDQPFVCLLDATRAPGGADRGPPSSRRPPSGHEQRLHSLVSHRLPDRCPPSRNARPNAPRRTARAWQASRVARHSHAPRPGSVRP
jgi:hypothetical protein